ncbi:hypothetical protein C8J56DRAFT_962341 [Mycena floridula]|nr:hypothetical protein C8J56DRAFT_962341 [Mycena floridula]
MSEKPSPISPIDAEGPLHVDARPRRKAGSGFKFLLCGAGVILLFILSAGLFLLARNAYEYATFAHTSLYQNQTLDQVQDRSLVVQPLIGSDTTFDIAVSVWQRRSNAEYWTVEDYETPREKAIYSDIVFRGLSLREKHVRAEVKFQIPTSVFRERYLYGNDIRASFVLIPSSPSLLDYFDSSAPLIGILPTYGSCWSDPFPLGSSPKNRTKAELALEFFAVSIPLVKMFEIPSQCPKSDKEDDVIDPNKEILEKHPFVVTRTQLRVADETHIFNKKAFEKAHKALFARCKWSCPRNYRDFGHLENLLKLSVPDETSVEGYQTEYAYAPYMTHFGESISPKDLVRVPVTREICPNATEGETVNDSESMDITWQLSYSGRTPAKMVLGEFHESILAPAFRETWKTKQSATEWDKAMEHETVQTFNGLFGHRYSDDVHPLRRVWIFWPFLIILPLITWTLNILYWYRCTSLVFISIPGTALLATGEILEVISKIVTESAKNEGLAQWIWVVGLEVVTKLPLPLLMLKAILRLELLWHGWVPSLQRTKSTHAERSSERLDSKISGTQRLAIVAFFYAILLVMSKLNLLDPIIPQPSSENWYAGHITTFGDALSDTGKVSQLFFNHKTRIFAGEYKTRVWINLLDHTMSLLTFVPAVGGKVEARPGIPFHYCITIVVWIVPTVWQATVLPRPAETSDEDEK